MKRIRNLGLAAVAALALTAVVGAGSASASAFVVSPNEHNPEYGYPATINGDAKGLHMLNTNGFWWECQKAHFGSESLAGPSSTLTPAMHKGAECHVQFGPSAEINAPMEFNGCKFIFHTGEEVSAGRFDGTVDIGPAGCGPIVLNYWTGCNSSLELYAGTGFEAEFYNEGTGDSATVRAEVDMYGIDYRWPCSGTFRSDGQYFGTWSLEGWNEFGEQIPLRVE